MPNIRLQCSDSEVVEVDIEIANKLLENLGFYFEDDKEILPLANVNAAILRKMITWVTQHKNDPPKISKEDGNRVNHTDDIDPWDKEFLKVELQTLFELINAAHYLNIEGLVDVCCKSVANMIKGKTAEEIRKTFNIKNDFTPEEKEQVRRENEWCEDK